MKVKAAIIGTGRIAGLFDSPNKNKEIATHAQALHKTPGIELVAACDDDRKRLSSFCKRWNVSRRYSDIDKLLCDVTPDVVSVCSMSSKHFLMIKQIIKHKNAPKVLFVEKPLCVTEAEMKQLIQLINKAKTLILVNHKYRFHQGLRKVSQIIKERTLGSIHRIHSNYYGGLLNNGVHIVDMIRMISGWDLDVVSATRGFDGRGGDYCVDTQLRKVRI